VDDVAGFAWVEDIFGWKRKWVEEGRKKKEEGRRNRVGVREWVNEVKVSLKKCVWWSYWMATGVLSHFNNGNYSKDWKWSYSHLDVIIMSKNESIWGSELLEILAIQINNTLNDLCFSVFFRFSFSFFLASSLKTKFY